MECSCGSTSFAPSSATLKVDGGALLFEYSACRGCGRQGAERLSDKMTGAVMATGYEAVMRVQQIEADDALFTPQESPQTPPEPLNVDHSQGDSGYAPTVEPHLAPPADERPEDVISTHVAPIAAEKAPSTPERQDGSGRQRMNDRGRHYLLWEGEFQKARVLYYQRLYEGYSEVAIPWLGLEKNTSQAGLGCADLLLACLQEAKAALEQHFGEITVQSSVTCAPPTSIPLEIQGVDRRPSGHSHLQDADGPAEEYLTFEFLHEIPAVSRDDVSCLDTPSVRMLDDPDPLAPETPTHEEQLSLF
jgi:hypothetical protein